MPKNLKFVAAAALLIFTLAGCGFIEGLFNPFQGRWKAGIGMMELEFGGDGTFEFVMGTAISLNLGGTYTYDKKNLVLKFEGGSEVSFSYEFSDGKERLALTPETDFEYIRTRLEFKRQ